MRPARAFVTFLIICIFQSISTAQKAQSYDEAGTERPVRYVVALFNLDQHLLHIHLQIPPGPSEHDLQLPVWNALYQIRDFAQYVNWIRARSPGGRVLDVRQIDKSKWHISGAQDGAVVDYEFYADSPGPFGAEVNSHHAFLNLAEVLMYPVDDRSRRDVISFEVPNGWHIATPLQGPAFEAANYDRLVDSPVEIGDFKEADFEEAGGHFRVIVDADPADYDMPNIVGQLHKLVAAETSWMNDRPFDSYMFLYHFPRGAGGGGMEHAYSTAIELNAGMVKQLSDGLAVVTAHEFFHLWNVKRIRPQGLEPIDYTKENYTPALWFSEGVTSTVEGIAELRAGLIDEKLHLQRMSDQITELERRPAHLTQSAEDSSLDAWLEGNAYYRRPERSISYYNKGELLGDMLDLEVRESTHGQASLREVMQWMNDHYAKRDRYFDDSNGVREAAEAVSHADLGWFFTKYVSGTEEIPWDDFLRTVGLHVETGTSTVPDPGFVASRSFDGPMSVEAVTPGSEAEAAGLQAGDVILELQGKPAAQDSRQQLSKLKAGDSVALKIRGARGEREVTWKMGSRQEISYEIKDLVKITAAQRVRRVAWLKGEAETAPTQGSTNQTPQP